MLAPHWNCWFSNDAAPLLLPPLVVARDCCLITMDLPLKDFKEIVIVLDCAISPLRPGNIAVGVIDPHCLAALPRNSHVFPINSQRVPYCRGMHGLYTNGVLFGNNSAPPALPYVHRDILVNIARDGAVVTMGMYWNGVAQPPCTFLNVSEQSVCFVRTLNATAQVDVSEIVAA